MCITEQPEFASPVVATASWGYARLHRFDYDDAALTAWATKIAALPWTEAYVFFKHDEGIGSGPPAVGSFMKASRMTVTGPATSVPGSEHNVMSRER